MDFGKIAVENALGAISAHAVRCGETMIAKGQNLGPEQIEALKLARIRHIWAARLAEADLNENEAASFIADRLAGTFVRVASPVLGRADIIATTNGLVEIDADLVIQLNAFHEAIGIATLARGAAVRAGDVIASVKVIPLGMDRSLLEEGMIAAADCISVLPYRSRSVATILTTTPELKSTLVGRSLEALDGRLRLMGLGIGQSVTVDHDSVAVASALSTLEPADIVVIFGAQSTVDRRDIIPKAIVAAGGTISHFGLPVDPGHLLLLGQRGNNDIVVAPGCARTNRISGFDWILRRLVVGLPLGRSEIASFGVGGLMKEVRRRPKTT